MGSGRSVWTVIRRRSVNSAMAAHAETAIAGPWCRRNLRLVVHGRAVDMADAGTDLPGNDASRRVAGKDRLETYRYLRRMASASSGADHRYDGADSALCDRMSGSRSITCAGISTLSPGPAQVTTAPLAWRRR
jgi:hypothetical protein